MANRRERDAQPPYGDGRYDVRSFALTFFALHLLTARPPMHSLAARIRFHQTIRI